MAESLIENKAGVQVSEIRKFTHIYSKLTKRDIFTHLFNKFYVPYKYQYYYFKTLYYIYVVCITH